MDPPHLCLKYAEKNATIYIERWILVHSGPCIERQELSFKPMSSADEPVSRMSWYFTELENSLKNHTTLPPLDEFPKI
ncbi:unnamed protein product, partial [Brenthis ino]